MTVQELKKDIEAYIKEHNYTWTFDEIIDQLNRYNYGFYVSHTAKEIIKAFESRIYQINGNSKYYGNQGTKRKNN
jgi:tRNA(Ile)-lysidine synthase TilS/MesJ